MVKCICKAKVSLNNEIKAQGVTTPQSRPGVSKIDETFYNQAESICEVGLNKKLLNRRNIFIMF